MNETRYTKVIKMQKSKLKGATEAHFAKETAWKAKSKANSLFGAITSAEKLYQRVIKKLSIKPSQTSIAGFNIYEISRAHRTQLMEFELQRAKALAEVHRQRLHSL